MVHHAKENFGIWRNRQPHGANPTAFLSGEDLGIPSGDVGIPTQSPAGAILGKAIPAAP